MTDKGKILSFPDTAAIDAEAAAWVARFDLGAVSAKDQAAFQEWLHRSTLHREAIAEYGNLWSEFDELRLLTGRREAGGETRMRESHPALLTRATPWLAACAAAVIAVAGGMAVFHPKPQQLAKSESHSPTKLFYETAVGAQRRIALADGSRVILNTNSRLSVDFSGNRREVHLMRGEAYFEVVHNKARPFTVYANNYEVRDIGTAFNVHLAKAGMVEVGVTRGSVEVMTAPDGHVAGAAKSLGVIAAGHDIVLGEKVVARAVVVSDADLGRRLAWRQGELNYTGQPLAEVLADVSRYSDIKIELADPSLATLPVGGTFRTDQIDAIFAALEDNFDLHAEWIGPQHVRFTAGHDKAPSKG
jgi:transmembrane sensor